MEGESQTDLLVFGKVADGWEAALADFEKHWPHIVEHGCRKSGDPQVTPADSYRIADLCNVFLNAKRETVEADKLSPRTFRDCQRPTDSVVGFFDRQREVASLNGDDFSRLLTHLAKRHKSMMNRKVQIVRTSWRGRSPANWGTTEAPAMTLPQLRRGVASVLRRHLKCDSPFRVAARIQQRLRRNQQARDYHWKRPNIRPPTNLDRRRF